MQPIRTLERGLRRIANAERYLFTLADLEALLPECSDDAVQMVAVRAVRNGILERMCQGIYLCPTVDYARGFELFHVAARLRAGCFNYISKETALSDHGIIAQVPIGYVTIMSSGRSNMVDCGAWGRIEFTHTKKNLEAIMGELTYDERFRLLRAGPRLALADLKASRRNLDLVDWSMVDGLAVR